MHGTQKRAEILRVLVCGLCAPLPMSVMYPSSSKFRCIWRSAQRSTLGKEPFSRRCCWTHVCQGIVVKDIVADILRQQQWPYLANPAHKMHISVFFVGKWHVFSFCSLHSYHSTKWLLSLLSETLLALQHEYAPLCTSATLQLLQTRQPCQVGPMCTYTVWHFWLRISSGIKRRSTDPNSESLVNITHRSNVSVLHTAHAASWTCGHVWPVGIVPLD